jgi:probable phosphomutase (TIGR03848 family)
MPEVFLDEIGEASAHKLAKRLATVPVCQVVTSPLERTVQTSQLVFGETVAVAHEERLIECDYGLWQGRELAELAKDDLWSVVQKTPDEMVFPDGESMLGMAERAVTAVREWDAKIVDEHGDKAIWAAVSHGDVIKAICADALGIPLRKFQRIVIEPASVSVIHYNKDSVSLSKLNDAGDSWITQLVTPFEGATLGGQSGKGAQE